MGTGENFLTGDALPAWSFRHSAPRGDQPLASNKSFYLRDAGGSGWGPITEDELRAWIKQHRVSAEMLIRQEGQLKWHRVGDVPALSKALQSDSPRSPRAPIAVAVSGHSTAMPAEDHAPQAVRYWIAAPGGEPRGPFDRSSISAAIASGQIKTSDLACLDGDSNWIGVAEVFRRHQAPLPKGNSQFEQSTHTAESHIPTEPGPASGVPAPTASTNQVCVVVGGLLVAFGVIDFVGSFFGLDVWRDWFGIRLPPLLWKFSPWIEMTIGYALIQAGSKSRSAGGQ